MLQYYCRCYINVSANVLAIFWHIKYISPELERHLKDNKIFRYFSYIAKNRKKINIKKEKKIKILYEEPQS